MKYAKIIVTILLMVFASWYLHRSWKFKEAVEANNAAKIKLESQQFEEALGLLELAQKYGSQDNELMAIVAHHRAVAYSGLGMEKFREKAYKSALPLLNKVTNMSRRITHDHNTWFYIGECYRNLAPRTTKNTQNAIAAYKKLLKDSPENDDAQLALETMRARLEALPLREKGLSAFRSGNYSEAEPVFRRFIEKPELMREMDDIYPRYRLAVIEFESGRPRKALFLLRESGERGEGGEAFDARRRQLLDKILEKYPNLKGTENSTPFNTLFD